MEKSLRSHIRDQDEIIESLADQIDALESKAHQTAADSHSDIAVHTRVATAVPKLTARHDYHELFTRLPDSKGVTRRVYPWTDGWMYGQKLWAKALVDGEATYTQQKGPLELTSNY